MIKLLFVLNFTLALVLTYFTEGLSIFLDVEGSLIFSSDNSLDFHDQILLALMLNILKYL